MLPYRMLSYRPYRSEEGSVLFSVAIVMAILLLLGATLMSLSGTDHFLSARLEKKTKAYYIAYSGADAVANYLIRNPEELDSFVEHGPSGEIPFGAGSFNVTVTNNEGAVEVESTGRVGDYTERLILSLIYEEFKPQVDLGVYAYDPIGESGSYIVGEYGDSTTVGERQYPLPTFMEFPEGLPYEGDLTTPWVPGLYYPIEEDSSYNLIQATSSRTITVVLNGGDRLICVRNLDLQQGHIVLQGEGRVIFFVEESFRIQGSSSINLGGDSKNVMIYYRGTQPVSIPGHVDLIGCLYVLSADVYMEGSGIVLGGLISGGGEIEMTGSAITGGVIYAPNAEVNMDGTALVNGSLICDNFQAMGGALVIHDESVSWDDLPPMDFDDTGLSSLKKGIWRM